MIINPNSFTPPEGINPGKHTAIKHKFPTFHDFLSPPDCRHLELYCPEKSTSRQPRRETSSLLITTSPLQPSSAPSTARTLKPQCKQRTRPRKTPQRKNAPQSPQERPREEKQPRNVLQILKKQQKNPATHPHQTQKLEQVTKKSSTLPQAQ